MIENQPSDAVVIRTDVIPAKLAQCKLAADATLDLQAICVFAATGFFLESDDYWTNRHVLQPGAEYILSHDGVLRRWRRYWSWHYHPREISFDQAVDEFAHLFERIVASQVAEKRVILPLSGGLDSRTQAAALARSTQLHTYSYRFENGHDEVEYGRQIAREIGAPFSEYVIRRGYLWNVIDELARINRCMSDFTHPRQMAVIGEIASLGEVFALGHWGDVMFDDMGVLSSATLAQQVDVVLGKIVRRGGSEIANELWRAWGLAGAFEEYLRARITSLLDSIKIEDANARIRAFKSLYWAPRWTTVNLAVFANRRQIALPYYHRDMCEWICTVPERFLARRQIQIEYLKRRAPALARIAWQSVHPLNLYTHHHFRSPWMMPYRVVSRASREVRTRLMRAPHVSRNWELQFVGPRNEAELAERLFASKAFDALVPRAIVSSIYRKFTTGDRLRYAHPVSMLLTLAMFAELNQKSLS